MQIARAEQRYLVMYSKYGTLEELQKEQLLVDAPDRRGYTFAVAINGTDGFTVYVANLRSYHKTEEIAANPRVELCYLDDHHDQVRITGVAEVVTDACSGRLPAMVATGEGQDTRFVRRLTKSTRTYSPRCSGSA